MAELRTCVLLEAYDQLERDVGREVDIALKRGEHHGNLEAKVGVQEQPLEAESKRFRTMDKALHDAQEDLAEAQGRLAQYEAGVYGLSEAMRDLKALRMQVRAADQQVEDAVAQSNALGRKVEDLTEETRFLRQQAGIPEDADIDLGGFKLKSKVEAAQLRALNSQLEREVADLEEDRRRLRNELRYRAKWQGEHAARLGLSARQLAMLEEYADALRFGDDAVFKEDLVRYDGSSASDTEGQAPSVRYDPAVGIGARAVKELEAANKQLQEHLRRRPSGCRAAGPASTVSWPPCVRRRDSSSSSSGPTTEPPPPPPSPPRLRPRGAARRRLRARRRLPSFSSSWRARGSRSCASRMDTTRL